MLIDCLIDVQAWVMVRRPAEQLSA